MIIVLTSPRGDNVYFATEHIVAFRPALIGETAAGAKTCVELTSGHQHYVKENPTQVHAKFFSKRV